MASGGFKYALRGFRWPSVTTIAIILAVVFLWTWTGSNRFCGSLCHADKQEYEAWKKSSHARADCLDCHKAGGRFSLVGNKFFAIRRVVQSAYLGVTGEKANVNPDSKLADRISSGICLRCHSLNRITPSKGIIIDHNKHAKKGINCTTCHNRVAHSGIKEYKDFMSMRSCYRCHGTDSNAIVMVECGACHSEYFFPKTHKPLDFVSKKHVELAKEDPEYCIMCHRQQLCNDCHANLKVGPYKPKSPADPQEAGEQASRTSP